MSGIGSRRSVEPLIESGRVSVNSEVETTPGRKIDPNSDTVSFDGVSVKPPQEFSYYLFNKPKNVISSFAKQDDRKTLLDYRNNTEMHQNINPVGRLDADTTGLLIWTDDGTFAQNLLKPSNVVWKKYFVTTFKPITESQLKTLANGSIILDGRPCLPARASYLNSDQRNICLEIHEGRNRQIRRMLLEIGHRVNDLHRFAFGPIELGNLQQGEFRKLNDNEINLLRKSTGVR